MKRKRIFWTIFVAGAVVWFVATEWLKPLGYSEREIWWMVRVPFYAAMVLWVLIVLYRTRHYRYTPPRNDPTPLVDPSHVGEPARRAKSSPDVIPPE